MARYPTEGLRNASVADLAWLAGSWQGQRGPDIVDEYWSPIGGGTMMGMFRWQKEGQVWFYELLTLEPHEGQVMMRIKHFNPGLKGWEEKDASIEFLLVQVAAREAIFLQQQRENPPWIVYRLESDDRLISYFEREGEPPTDETIFAYHRTSL